MAVAKSAQLSESMLRGWGGCNGCQREKNGQKTQWLSSKMLTGHNDYQRAKKIILG